MAESTSLSLNPSFTSVEDFLECSRCLKRQTRVFNARIKNMQEQASHDNNFYDTEEKQKILDRKIEIKAAIKDVIHVCEECQINVEKLEIETVRRRDDRGRHHDPDADSGIESNVYSGNPSSGVQEVTPHTYSQSIDTQQVWMQETTSIDTSAIEVPTNAEK